MGGCCAREKVLTLEKSEKLILIDLFKRLSTRDPKDKENYIFQKDLLINEFLDYPEIGVMLYYYADLYCYPEPITLEKFLHFS